MRLWAGRKGDDADGFNDQRDDANDANDDNDDEDRENDDNVIDGIYREDDDNVIDGMRLWPGRMVLLGGAWRLLGDGSPHFKPGFLHSHDP